MNLLRQTLKQYLPTFQFEYDYPLASSTYFKLGGSAEAFISLGDKKDIGHLTKICHQQHIPLTVIGGASNVIIADEGVTGVVLKITHNSVTELIAASNTQQYGVIRAGAGIKTAMVVKETVDLGYTGLEYFLGVPGTLGGAVYNNAHYLEELMGEHVSQVEVIKPDGTSNWVSHEDCLFSYDSSRFQNTEEIIYEIEFHLPLGNAAHSRDLIAEATRYRAKTQPLGLPSSGCIFQNPPMTDELRAKFPQFADRKHIPGGFLIDQAGLKGERVGDIEVSHKHAAFMINRGHGTAAELRQLIKLVKQQVKEKFGVTLQEEVFYLN